MHYFIYSSGFGSDFLTSYGSGFTNQKVTVPTVPVPQRWYPDFRIEPVRRFYTQYL
jgi:hypothetical protein